MFSKQRDSLWQTTLDSIPKGITMTDSKPQPNGENISAIVRQIADEVRRATIKHKPLNSSHEAYGVILEELDEFWEEVKKKSENRSNESMRTELIQTAAMCVRTIYDLNL